MDALGFRGGKYPTASSTLDLVRAHRQNLAAEEERRLLKALGDYCHTKAEAWHDDSRFELVVRVGHTIEHHVTHEFLDRSGLASPRELVAAIAPDLRDRWFRYTPEIPPNIVLGED